MGEKSFNLYGLLTAACVSMYMYQQFNMYCMQKINILWH